MSNILNVDTTGGGYYLGASSSDGDLFINVDENDGHGNKVDYIRIKITPSNAKELAFFLKEYADSMADSGGLL